MSPEEVEAKYRSLLEAQIQPPMKDRDSAWYEELFRLRWTNLSPYSGVRNYEYDLHKLNLGVRKLTDAILYSHINTDRFVLPKDPIDPSQSHDLEILIGTETASGAFMQHDRILKELHLPYAPLRRINGLVFEATDDNKYILLPGMSADWMLEAKAGSRGEAIPEYMQDVSSALERYGIDAMICGVDPLDLPNMVNYKADPRLANMIISDPKALEKYQKIAWDGYTTKVAQKRGWTNNQWMHFRLFPYELPE
ncbi:MAG TPA: hypothetical protein VMR41_06445 [Patescibacteria group bacterium]|nr:hypothetical protein [Patescibacteria group bacterium]